MLSAKYLHYDRGTKFTAGFDSLLKVSGIQAIKTPKHAPNANAFAEVWVGSLKRECLNFFTCFSLGHVRHIVEEYVSFYNRHRPHQGVGNRILSEPGASTLTPKKGSTGPPIDETIASGWVRCNRIFGVLLKHTIARRRERFRNSIAGETAGKVKCQGTWCALASPAAIDHFIPHQDNFRSDTRFFEPNQR